MRKSDVAATTDSGYCGCGSGLSCITIFIQNIARCPLQLQMGAIADSYIRAQHPPFYGVCLGRFAVGCRSAQFFCVNVASVKCSMNCWNRFAVARQALPDVGYEWNHRGNSAILRFFRPCDAQQPHCGTRLFDPPQANETSWTRSLTFPIRSFSSGMRGRRAFGSRKRGLSLSIAKSDLANRYRCRFAFQTGMYNDSLRKR